MFFAHICSEISYLGHFHFTFMLGEKGFNELDMALFKHLIHNQKQCCFVRTQCDSQIHGIQENCLNNDLSAETAFKQLQDEFRSYMNEEVIPKTKLENNLVWFKYGFL